MHTLLTVAGSLMIVLGAFVFLGAALGLVRFPDPYSRISATGTAGGVGMILVVVGALCHLPTVPNLVKVVLIVVLMLGTASVSTMALARASYLTGVPMRPGHYDELAEDTPGREHGEPAPRAADAD